MFSIVGRDHERFVSMTRIQPSGAALLAQDWLARGFTDVRIEWEGRSCSFPDFRQHLVHNDPEQSPDARQVDRIMPVGEDILFPIG